MRAVGIWIGNGEKSAHPCKLRVPVSVQFQWLKQCQKAVTVSDALSYTVIPL